MVDSELESLSYFYFLIALPLRLWEATFGWGISMWLAVKLDLRCNGSLEI